MSRKHTVEKKRDIRNGIKRVAFAAVSVLLQIIWLYVGLYRLGELYSWITVAVNLLASLLVLYIYSTHVTAAMKMPWIVLIMAFPFLGVMLYLMVGLNGGTYRMKKCYQRLDERLLPLLQKDFDNIEELEQVDAGVAGQSRYIQNYTGYPAYGNTDIVFFEDSAEAFEAQLREIEKAEKFVFMEYHAIEDAEAFGALHTLLKEKVEAGVEVRIFYDYMGSVGFIGNEFVKKMEADGIRCRVFNPVLPFFNVFLNNRDHRKITVIDGKVGFVGGYNLADEYFHISSPYGYWLDTGVRMEGDAVKSLTITFLENWNAIKNDDKEDADFLKYLVNYPYKAKEKGIVQPYADSPLDEERVGENVYINVLRNARKYAYFTTPYLIITDEMNNAFAMAAKSGVDVRIITPGIPDKKMIFGVTRSYYAGLVKNGVRIFEFTPGFCHAKQCVSDDKVAICGTINLDFRSLYHHFENAVFFYDYKAVHDVKNQFDDLFEQCHEVTQEYRGERSGALRLKQMILRLIAPLM